MIETAETHTQTLDSSSKTTGLSQTKTRDGQSRYRNISWGTNTNIVWRTDKASDWSNPSVNRGIICSDSESNLDETIHNSEASGLRRNREFIIPSRNRYDMVAGVQTKSHRRNRLHRDTIMDNLTTYDHKQPEDDDDEPDMTQFVNAITNVPTLIQRKTHKHKLLQTQIPTFKGLKKRYNEFELRALALQPLTSFSE